MNRLRLILLLIALALFFGVRDQSAIASGGTTQNCCNLAFTIGGLSSSVGTTSAQINWSTSPTQSNSTVVWGATTAPSWRTLQQISSATFNDVSIVSSLVQWAVDDTGRVLRTTDGWNTYSTLTNPGPATLSAIAATSDSTAWVVSGGSIYKTTNGGVSWAQSSPAAAGGHVLRDIVMRDGSEGVAVGDAGTIIETTDGTNWTCIAGSAVGCPVNSWSVYNLTVVVGYFDSPSAKNYAVGGTGGTILKGTGTTLAFIQYPTVWANSTIASIDMAGPDIIWATNGSSQVLVKPNGTSTFTQGTAPNTSGAIVAYSATDAYYGTSGGLVYHIKNGGTAFDPALTITPPATGVTFTAGGHTTSTSATFVGTNGTVVRFASAYTSVTLDGTFTTSHSMLLTGLTPSTAYHYTVISIDSTVPTSWRVAELIDSSFTTAASGIPTTVTKSIGTGPGRNFTTPQTWEDARNGNLVTRSRLNVNANSGTFLPGENVSNPSASCGGTYVPEDQVRTNGPVLTLDGFSGTCTSGDVLTGSTSGAHASFVSVASNGGTLEVGEMYNDSVYTSPVTISGSITDTTHYIWLKAAAGNQHNGTRASGARFQLAAGRPITVQDSYTRIQGLEFDLKTRASYAPQAACIGYPAQFGILEDLLAYDGDYSAACIGDYVSNATIRNSIFYDNDKIGDGASIEIVGPHYAASTNNVYNNTVFRSGTGGIGVGGTGSTNVTIVARNNVVENSTQGDYRTSYSGQTASFTGSSNNLSSDPTAPGSASLPSSGGTQFRSTTLGSEDLRILNGSQAIDAGTNLSSQGFSNDFVGRNRNDTVNFGANWDLGAYEVDQSPPGTTGFTASTGYVPGSGYTLSYNLTSCATDNISGVKDYNLYLNGVYSSGIAVCPTGGALSGLAANTTYSVTVRAINNDGFEAPPGTAVVVTTPSPNFTVGLSKSTLVATAGGTGDTSTITVSSQNGFTGTVNLSNTLPQGAGSFAPASISVPKDGSATAVWTVTAPSGTPPGNYSATVTGTSGGLTVTATATEQITDFALGAASPATGSVVPGGSTTFNVPVTMSNSSPLFNYVASGASNPSTVSITYSWSPLNAWTQSGTANRTQGVTVNTSSSTPAGSYTITISVAYHGKTVSTPFTLTVLNPDYSISANPTTLTVNQGSTVTENGVLTAVSGYTNAAVTVSVTGLPVGVTATTSTVALDVASSPKTVPLSITVPAAQATGTYTPTIRAQDSTGLVRTVGFTLIIGSPYTVAASPTSDSTIQGGSKTFNVVVTGSNGYTDTVNTTFTTSNPGITVAPATSSISVSGVTPAGQTTETVNVGSAVPVGIYSVTLNATGAGSGVTRSATYTISVGAAPDFSITVSPSAVTVEAGQSATYNLAFPVAGGYTGTVNLSISGLPASIPTATFTPGSVGVPTPGASTLTIPVPYDPATVGGPYTFTITGNDGTKTRTVTGTLTVNADSTAPVILSGPTATPGGCPTPTTCTATIAWTTNEPADGTVQYSTDLSFSSTSFAGCSTPTSCPTTHTITLSGLSEATLYNYRVVSRNPFGLTVTSSNRTFTTGTAPDTTPPTLSFTVPTNGATVQGVLTITVTAGDNKAVASLSISETAPLHPSGQTLGSFTAPTTGTPQNGTYTTTWDTNDPSRGENNGSVTLSAQAVDGSGNTQSATITITVNNDKTPPVITAGPTVNVQVSGTTATATISWNTNEASTTSVQYGLERSDGTYTYGSWIDNLTLNTAHQVVLSNLQLNSRYHYQIRSCDASNNCVY